ncbi:DUF1415 domain-containing protein [Thalassolituus sp. C2-1]|uniref:DUF1415 domain-containing protein n=1 Tax=Venatorbacter sp. C2-1 TaxID=2597518 RepID=UPI0021043414|nr:DUF1415 domain-containing protein [Thalassolituus sp. C2-1]
MTREWVKQLVIGEGLCPFAAPVFDSLRIDVCDSSDPEQATLQFMELLREVAEADAAQLPTALFVVPSCFDDFDLYWNWLLICDNLLAQMGYEGVLQLASFHPHYLFEGEDEDDMSHFTNRSPYPMLHIIREADIEQALASVSRPERIPERNRQHMRRLGKEGLLQCMPALAQSRLFQDAGDITEHAES